MTDNFCKLDKTAATASGKDTTAVMLKKILPKETKTMISVTYGIVGKTKNFKPSLTYNGIGGKKLKNNFSVVELLYIM